MKKYLLPQTGNFYKANLHCHTTCSDGTKTPREIKELYRSMGYSIVAFTDHDVLLPHDELNDEGFLALHGFEAEITEKRDVNWTKLKCCHICMIGLEPDNITQPLWNSDCLFAHAPEFADKVAHDENEKYQRIYSGEGISEMIRLYREHGFFVTYNHPTWSMESYPEYMGYHGMNAFEMFNGGCMTTGFEDYNPRVYEDLLSRGEPLYCIGADDNHNGAPYGSRHCDSGIAFTVIKADSLDYRTVTRALEAGSFYASEAPEIYGLWYENGRVHIDCSPADRIICIPDTRDPRISFAENGVPLTEADFSVSPEWTRFRITVTDKNGKHACTNAFPANTL